jgi:hypothetical protein
MMGEDKAQETGVYPARRSFGSTVLELNCMLRTQ